MRSSLQQSWFSMETCIQCDIVWKMVNFPHNKHHQHGL